MGHKCYISFKTENLSYKQDIQEDNRIDMIDKSLNEAIDSEDEDYIMRSIRENYLSDSTVTIFLIGSKSAEYFGAQEQRFIKRELQASLYNGSGNTRNGILGIVLPEVRNQIYLGEYQCGRCGTFHSTVAINDYTAIKEFSYNYYLPKSEEKCSWQESDRYCVLVDWMEFKGDPNKYIDMAFNKRSDPIAQKVKVRP